MSAEYMNVIYQSFILFAQVGTCNVFFNVLSTYFAWFASTVCQTGIFLLSVISAFCYAHELFTKPKCELMEEIIVCHVQRIVHKE